MLLVGSSNAQIGFAEGMKVLRRGGRAVDAVEATIRIVESNADDHSVGYGGLPNILGEVELDASIMDGRRLESGAVCAVHGYEHVISIARQVMDRLPHVLLAGPGAERFAGEMGFQAGDLLTPEARAIFEGRLDRRRYRRRRAMRDLVIRALRTPAQRARDADHFGTVNVIARDRSGDIASGVSTSGLAWKYPGRVGDSPVIGAGNYADNRYGACACTGDGELAQRCNTAHSVILYMKMGRNLKQACQEAIRDLRHLTTRYPPVMSLVAIDASGNHAALTTESDRVVKYVYQTDVMDEPSVNPRSVVRLTYRTAAVAPRQRRRNRKAAEK